MCKFLILKFELQMFSQKKLDLMIEIRVCVSMPVYVRERERERDLGMIDSDL